ncbi:MAG: hydroxymethylglutaryl-CoA lyase [Actinobacteria bacterium]|nr:hydroxymethylglutaryl-CoA lyase [Actinomycetota bacterium]
MSELPSRVVIREVGPRDGLQSEKPVPVEGRVRLIDALSLAGFAKIEAVSFVSPKAVPAMADADRVLASIKRAEETTYSALVPNRLGAQRAVDASAGALTGFLAASDGYNTKNVGKTVEESVRDVADVAQIARDAGLPVEATISSAFGDPYEGEVPPSRVAQVAGWLADAGITSFSLGDTTGMASPPRITAAVDAVRERVDGAHINLHLHDTRGAAMANAFAGLQAGVTEFDASIGGLGGSPFAPQAGGNLATEDFVHLLHDMGIQTGLDLDALLRAADVARELVGHDLWSHLPKSGPASAP